MKSDKLCFYSGGKTGFNVKKTLDNIGEILYPHYELDLVTSEPDAFLDFLDDRYSIYNYENPFPFGDNSYNLYRYLNSNNPTAITTIIMPHTLGFSASILSSIYDVPYVYRYPSDDLIRYKTHNGWRRFAYYIKNNVIGKVPIKLTSKYIVLGPAGFSHLTEIGTPAEDVFILPQPMDNNRFDDTDQDLELDIPTNVPVGLFVGRRAWLKGYDRMEKALPEILFQRPDMHFIIIGCGHELPDVPPSLHDRIHPIGNVKPDCMPSYFHRAGFLLVTSRGEGLPRVILEALLSNTPVIAPPVGEIPSVITDTYGSIDELIQQSTNFENKKVDEASSYTIENLKSKYLNFYSQF
jgi:glycosyltransferase involved in cell wall biosynthesis